MNPQLATVLVMALLITASGLLDWWLAKTYGQQATMTNFIRRVTLHNIWLQVAICVAFGMMIGHFFLWPAYPPPVSDARIQRLEYDVEAMQRILQGR